MLLLLFQGVSYTLAIEAGSFTLSGQAVGLRATRKIDAAAGSYTLSGQAAGLHKDFLLPAGTGAYVLTGRNATLVRGHVIGAAAASYAFAGQATELRVTRRLIVKSAAYLGYTPSGATVFRNIRRAASGRPLLLLEDDAAMELYLDLTDFLEPDETISSVTVTSSGPTVSSSNTTTKVTLTISAPMTGGDIRAVITLSSGQRVDETILCRIPLRVSAMADGG